jgi:SAM-dependent methyltransferase
MTYTETGVSTTIDRLLEAAIPPDGAGAGAGAGVKVTAEQLDRLDQFHLGGLGAVDRMLPSLRIGTDSTVIDVGSGLGGPARRIAELSGATVVGVDITEEYVDAARALTRRVGLEGRVSFQHSGIAEHQPTSPYDAAVTMHVQMNVADKAAWFSAIAARLGPGARLATWEVVSAGSVALTYPMPWSMDGSDSHVVSPDELLSAITSAGFSTLAWVDDTEWVKDWLAAAFGGSQPAGPGIAMLIDDGLTRVINVSSAVQSGAVQIYRGAFVKG